MKTCLLLGSIPRLTPEDECALIRKSSHDDDGNATGVVIYTPRMGDRTVKQEEVV
jgi:hypothetical protein